MKLTEWAMKLNDGLSNPLGKINAAGDVIKQKLNSLSNTVAMLGIKSHSTGTNIDMLSSRLELLRQKRNLIDVSNVTQLREVNREISALQKNIDGLEKVNGGVVKGWFKDAFNNIPGNFSQLITNPVVAASIALASITTGALSFDAGMSKVNATAQLSKENLNLLKGELLDLGAKSTTDLNRIPEAFDKINSLINNVPASLEILKASLQGAKAGFADIDVVGNALASTMSIIGDNNVKVADVLDTLMSAKKFGKGEFQDFAQYVPGLIASGKALGMGYKDTAGLFAYMTTKAATAADATVLLKNVFTALSKSDIRDGLKAQGIAVYDNEGKLRNMANVVQEVSAKLNGMSDESKLNFLEKIGLKDAQAKEGLMDLLADTNSLKTIMGGTANAFGETARQLSATQSIGQKLSETWNRIKVIGIKIGEFVLPIIGFGLDVINTSFQFVIDNSDYILAIMASLGAYLIWNNIGLITMGASWLIYTTYTTMAALATAAFKLTLDSLGIGLIIAAIAALAVGLYRLYQSSERLRAGIWALGNAIYQIFAGLPKLIIGTFGAIGKVLENPFDPNKLKAGMDRMKSAMSGYAKGIGNAFSESYHVELKDIRMKKAAEKANDPMAKLSELQKKLPTNNLDVQQPSTDFTSGNNPNSNVSKGLESVSGGGKEIRNVIVNIDKLVESFNFTTNNPAMSAAEIKMMVEDALLRAINGAEHSLAYSQ